MLFELIIFSLQLHNFCSFPKALNILLHILCEDVNRNILILLPNYYFIIYTMCLLYEQFYIELS